MEENIYVKQFPSLMEGKTILYVHGFGSSGQSGTVARLRTVLPRARVVAPDLPLHPSEAMELLRRVCQAEQPALIIGTSMGGMYAEMLTGFDRILVNPAFGIADTMGEHGLTGKQQFFSPRQDGVQEFYVDKALVKEYRAASEQNFAHAGDAGEQQHVFGLFGDEDELTHTRPFFEQHYSQAIPFHGGHRLNDQSFMHAVVPVVRWIDDRQERRERPIVYIGVETLADSRGLPASSMQKAVRQLIERYQVYFVATTLSTHSALRTTYLEVQEWLEHHIGVPAWRHIISTYRRDLLYGDYLVSKRKEGDTMATLLQLGSDTFKTWEDIIEYFTRLGGQ